MLLRKNVIDWLAVHMPTNQAPCAMTRVNFCGFQRGFFVAKLASGWLLFTHSNFNHVIPYSKVHGANMGPTWVLSAPDGPHVGPMNLAIKNVLANASNAVDTILSAVSVWDRLSAIQDRNQYKWTS